VAVALLKVRARALLPERPGNAKGNVN